MALALSDFKKTSRTTDLGRQLYPYQMRDDRYLAAIAYAISYYEQMLGRQRAEFDSATLLEFFGDPKLARGLVACLGRTYRWHQLSFGEVLSAEVWAQLQTCSLHTPADLRAQLYRYINHYNDGFLLPEERADALAALCADLPVTPSELEYLMQLDSEERAVLVRSGPTPEAADIIALYNFHSLETALRHTRLLTLNLSGPVWPLLLSIRNLARRYNLHYDLVEGPRTLFEQQLVVTWHGKKDALGSWSRHGRRLVRALLRLLAAHPDCAKAGVATVSIVGKTQVVKLSARELGTLGVASRAAGQGPEVWESGLDTLLASAWSRATSKRTTADWRLRRDPEPLVLERGVLVPNFIALRGPQRVPIFLPATAAGISALIEPLDGSEAAVVVVPSEAAAAFAGRHIPLVLYNDTPDVAAIVATLEQHFPAQAAASDRWSQLEALLAEHGFVAEDALLELLGCRSTAEIAPLLQGWNSDSVQFVPGLGLCTHAKVRELGALLARAA